MLKKRLLFLPIVSVIGLFLIFHLFQKSSETKVDARSIPEEVAHKQGYIKHLTPPDDFKAGIAWMQAIHDTRKPGNSKIEVDWMRLYARVNGSDILTASDEYDDKKVCGGLWRRKAWFSDWWKAAEEFPADFDQKGYLVLEISKQPDKIWHWWNCKRAAIPENAERCWMKARVRIQGPAVVQAGIDYWKTLDASYAGPKINNKEAAVSDWFFEEKGWQVISVAEPE